MKPAAGPLIRRAELADTNLVSAALIAAATWLRERGGIVKLGVCGDRVQLRRQAVLVSRVEMMR